MPIVTQTEDNKIRYYAVTEGHECGAWALIQEYKLCEESVREYVEQELREEYLRRLTEHARECALLAHLVLNPPDDDDDDDLAGKLKVTDRLAEKVAKDAVWLRTYDPFTGLTAEAVDDDEGTTKLLIACEDEHPERASSLNDDSWRATDRALWAGSPKRLAHFARMKEEQAAKEVASGYTPAGQAHIDAAFAKFSAAVTHARKLKERSTKTVANKTIRRTKRKAR